MLLSHRVKLHVVYTNTYTCVIWVHLSQAGVYYLLVYSCCVYMHAVHAGGMYKEEGFTRVVYRAGL